MAQKIYPTGFQPQYLPKQNHSLYLTGSSLKDSFFFEIELQRLINKYFLILPSLIKSLQITKSFRLGCIIVVNAVPLHLPKFSALKLQSPVTLRTQLRPPKKKFFFRFRDRSVGVTLKQKFFSVSLNQILYYNKFITFLQFLKKTKPGLPIQFYLKTPFSGPLRSRRFISIFSSLVRILYRFNNVKFFSTHILIAALLFYSRNWVSVSTQLIAQSFFRTRQHRSLFVFFSRMFNHARKKQLSFSHGSGYVFKMKGRFDKKKRSQTFSSFGGAVKRQQID